MKEKKKASFVLGILAIVFGLLFPIVGLILGIVGLFLAVSHQKESQLNYKTEKILNIVGIVVSVLNWIFSNYDFDALRKILTKKALFLKLFLF